MKKEYVSPKMDIIYTRLESELLAGSPKGDGTTQPFNAKAYSGYLDDFADESMWGDEAIGNNE